MAKLTTTEIEDITEKVYRSRLEADCKGNVARMIEKDGDDGKKLRGRSRSYLATVRATLEVVGLLEKD